MSFTSNYGNLLESPDRYIIHGVNCRNGFGSGIAGQIAKRWPQVKDKYHLKFSGEGWHLGEVQFCDIGFGKYIINAATQDKYGRDNLMYADYNAIRIATTKALAEASDIEWARTGKIFGEFGVSISRVGCGLGGAKWETVEEILSDISKVFPFVNITVWSLDGKQE